MKTTGRKIRRELRDIEQTWLPCGKEQSLLFYFEQNDTIFIVYNPT